MKSFKLDGPETLEQFAEAVLKEELADGQLTCEERVLGGAAKCADPASSLVRLDSKVYSLCRYHAQHAIKNRGGEEIANLKDH